jgi:hypothetical protein
MKALIYIAFIALTSIGVYAQENTIQELAESTKAEATKISQELNFDDDQALYLYRAIYSTEQSKQRAHDQLEENSPQLQEFEQKIENQFGKMLEAKFSESEIVSIKALMVKKE